MWKSRLHETHIYNLNSLSQSVSIPLEKYTIISIKAQETSCNNYISQETHWMLREKKNKCVLVETVLQDCWDWEPLH